MTPCIIILILEHPYVNSPPNNIESGKHFVLPNYRFGVKNGISVHEHKMRVLFAWPEKDVFSQEVMR